MPELMKREKVLVQYRLLKDFDDLRRRGIPGVDVRVMEDNIYEWHVTMSPLSGHFSGLRIHMVLLLPDDYPRRPPRVELYNYLPHANVFRDFLQATAQSWASYWRGASPSRGGYVLCTDLLEQKPPPVDPNDPCRQEGWSPSYSVEAVLVQLQCLLFDDYVHADTGHHINTLWEHWFAHHQGENGRKSRNQVCADLHRAQREADEFVCRACGFSGHDGQVAFYDKLPEPPSDDDSGGGGDEGNSDDGSEALCGGEGTAEHPDSAAAEAEAGGEEGAKPERRTPAFVSRKKQRKRELAELKIESHVNAKVDLTQQRLYMEISNSNSALVSGHALRRVPGVFKDRDVVSFNFHGVVDDAYSNGEASINSDLGIFNYGHEVEFPWLRKSRQPEEEKEEARKKSGKETWERFAHSQNGGGKLKAEDTPGTEAYVKKREKFFAAGVIEKVNPGNCTVCIVVAGSDGRLGSSRGALTHKLGEWSYKSDRHPRGQKAVLYKNVPMEKVKLTGFETAVVPYDHPPPTKYKPVPGHYGGGEFLAYDVNKDAPTQLVALLESRAGSEPTWQKLAALQGSRSAGTSEGFTLVDGPAPTEGSFELVDAERFEIASVACGSDGGSVSWDLVSEAAASCDCGSFEVVSVVSGGPSSLSHSFHVVPSGLGSATPDLHDGLHGAASSASSRASERSLLSLRSPISGLFPADAGGSWQLLQILCRLNVPVRGTVMSIQAFGAFVSIDATPRNLAVQNQRLLSDGGDRRGKGKGKGKGERGAERARAFQDGLLPVLPYMRPHWPPSADSGVAEGRRDTSVMVNGNVLEQIGRERDVALGPPEVTVYVAEVDVSQKRMKLSLQPRLRFEDLRVGGKHEGIVVDSTRFGLRVALSDDLVGLLPREQLGVGAFAEGATDDGWYRRSVYRRGDRVTVWVLRKALTEDSAGSESRPRRRCKIDLTMEKYTDELRERFFKESLQVLDRGACGRAPASSAREAPASGGKTAMSLQLERTFDEEDKFFLIKNNRIIQDAESQYPDLVIDYQTDPPPPPPPEAREERFDFSLIEGWTVQRISEEYKQLTDRQLAFERGEPAAKRLGSQEQKLLEVLKKKAEQWGKEYYERVSKKVEERRKFIEEIHENIKAERDKYPYKSIIDLDKFRELTARIKEKGYDSRCCFVTRLSYKEDVLGVGLEIVPEADTGRKVFKCSFDLLSKEAFKDFGIRSGVWKEKVEFWLPLAIDASHFRRALPFLAECFRELGDGRVEKQTRSYGTQAGSAKYDLRAQLREVERSGKKIISLDAYRKQQAERRMRPVVAQARPGEDPSAPQGAPSPPRPPASLTEADVAYGLEVLPKLMNLQTVQLMKGDLHLSTKALEGYMGFHHLLLSILRQYPSLQEQVEVKIGAFMRSEEARSKKSCPNIGEFLCLFAVSKRHTWDDVSAAVLKETLARNASWALDKYPSLSDYGISAQSRLERTFKASVVSIRLLCFNVWFLRHVVFKRYGPGAASADIIEAELRGGPSKSCMDTRWEEYEEQKGIPKPSEIELLQEQVRRTIHGEGLNSWAEYFASLNLQPRRPDELSQLLIMCLHEAVRKGYIPRWKLHPKAHGAKVSQANDNLGADMDKYDALHTAKGGGGDKW